MNIEGQAVWLDPIGIVLLWLLALTIIFGVWLMIRVLCCPPRLPTKSAWQDETPKPIHYLLFFYEDATLAAALEGGFKPWLRCRGFENLPSRALIEDAEFALGVGSDGFFVMSDKGDHCLDFIDACNACVAAKKLIEEVRNEEAAGKAEADKDARSRDTQPDGYPDRDPCC